MQNNMAPVAPPQSSHWVLFVVLMLLGGLLLHSTHLQQTAKSTSTPRPASPSPGTSVSNLSHGVPHHPDTATINGSLRCCSEFARYQ